MILRRPRIPLMILVNQVGDLVQGPGTTMLGGGGDNVGHLGSAQQAFRTTLGSILHNAQWTMWFLDQTEKESMQGMGLNPCTILPAHTHIYCFPTSVKTRKKTGTDY